MSSYQELIKSFERVRTYMRDFYLYGFKSREEYDRKSLRSYDNERRRIETLLGAHTHSTRTQSGKNVYLSIDSRVMEQNPLYRAWRSKSFTDIDITLHFILLDILSVTPLLTLPEIMERMDCDYLSGFAHPLTVDESTVRKKLKEYIGEGLVIAVKDGRQVRYRRAYRTKLRRTSDALHFFSEVAPCGVIGAFLLDRGQSLSPFLFKHHYITSALDCEVLLTLFDAMHQKASVTFLNRPRRGETPTEHTVLPLRIFISVQSGRQHLLAYRLRSSSIEAYRLDYISDIRIGEAHERFDACRAILDRRQAHMWGVSVSGLSAQPSKVAFTVRVEEGEEYIIGRLHREKRCGSVTQLDRNHYRFEVLVYDPSELRAFIRTFLCRITDLYFADSAQQRVFEQDLYAMYRMYGIDDEEVEDA